MATGKGSPDKILLEEDVKAIIAAGKTSGSWC
jgi:hypothetical protein